MKTGQQQLWVCKKCWRIMPKTDAARVAMDLNGLSRVAELRCPSCSAIGQFAPDSSPEFSEFANDLVFEAYAAALQEAGYEILEYSAQCDQGNHGHCSGQNRLLGEIPKRPSQCFCQCHNLPKSSVAESASGDSRIHSSQGAKAHKPCTNRVRESEIAMILQCIASPVNRRYKPKPGDLNGAFDFWFDGGAAREITGWTQYEFSHGICAKVDVVPCLSITVEFPNGSRVRIYQEN